MTGKPILVVGAGPTGLNLALWLGRLGAPVRIIDQDAGPGQTSRAMVVHARTLEFYRQLGFAQEVVDKGLKIETAGIIEDGKIEGTLPFGAFGTGLSAFPFILSFPQDEHELVLLAHVEQAGLTVERRTRLTGYTQDADGVTATLETPQGTEVFEASYIAGCDGGRSTVRHAAGIGQPGGTYAQRFYVADAAVQGEAASVGLSIGLSGPDFCIALPLRRTGDARLIGVVPEGIDRDKATFDDVAASVQRNTGLTVSAVHWFSTYNVHHRVADRFRDRRAFLLGDAAHLHSPVGGQGMNTGLGDGVNLAWKLAAVLAGRAAPALLDSYEPERIGFARDLVATTDKMFQLITNRGLLGKGWRTVVLSHLVPLAFKLPGVPRAVFKRISQTMIEYRDGPLSQGRAGDVQAGDRLPWVEADGADNFAPLASLDWQVHVYGAASDAVQAAAGGRGLPVHVMPWGEAAEACGLARDALYLVRPDGHVGLATDDPAALTAYLDRWGITMRGPA